MYSLKLYYDKLAPGAKIEYIEAQHSICYTAEGSVVLNSVELSADEALYCSDYLTAHAGPGGAEIWRWELERTEKPANLVKADGICSILRMARPIQMFQLVPTGKWLFRLDCIYECRGSTGLHSHPGSGIRSMLSGSMSVRSTVGENSDNDGRGAVWYEEGSYPLVSTVAEGSTANFLRGMVLPVEYMTYPDTATWIEGGKSVESEWKSYIQHVVTLR